MTGKEIYALGKKSPAARKIPLSFVHTTPRLYFNGNWYAEFWYYLQKFDGKKIFVSEPQFCLVFELPTKNLVETQWVKDKCNESFAEAPEVISKEFYSTLNNYLDFCSSVIEKSPDENILEELGDKWKETLPNLLKKWFNDKKFLNAEKKIVEDFSKLKFAVDDSK